MLCLVSLPPCYRPRPQYLIEQIHLGSVDRTLSPRTVETMAAIIAQLTRAKRERAAKKTYEPNKELFKLVCEPILTESNTQILFVCNF